jgi:hypothetical protein
VLLERHLIYNVPELTTEACLTVLTLVASLIPLDTAMVEEASQPSFGAQMATDANTFRSCCDTCNGLLSVTVGVLDVVGSLASQQELQSQQSSSVLDHDNETEERGSAAGPYKPAGTGAMPGQGDQQPGGSLHSHSGSQVAEPAATEASSEDDEEACDEACDDACDEEGGDSPTLSAPAQCTQQAALLLPVLASSALQLIHLTSTCTWYAQQAMRSPDGQQLLSVDDRVVDSLADLVLGLIRASNSLLSFGYAACSHEHGPDVTGKVGATTGGTSGELS